MLCLTGHPSLSFWTALRERSSSNPPIARPLQQEWAFVHDPENVFNPPSPRARIKVSPSHQARLKFDSHLLDEQLHMAGMLPLQQNQQNSYQNQQQLRSPPTKYPPLPPISRQPENEEGRRPFEAKNQEVRCRGINDMTMGRTNSQPAFI